MAAAPQLDLDPNALPLATAPKAKQQECVLLIEDNPEAMWLVRYAIDEYGEGRYRLEWAECLGDGLERLAQGGVDVVLLDLGLPESSGARSYSWVHVMAPKVPVVVLTGDSRDETEYAVRASGVAGYLVKDFASGSGLIRSLQAALTANRQGIEQQSGFVPVMKKRFRIK